MFDQVTAFLAPFVPSLLGQGGQLAGDVVSRFGDQAWQLAQKMWDSLWPRIQEREAAREAGGDVAARPGDKRVHGALELQIEKILRDHPDVAQDLEVLLKEGKKAGVVAASGGVVIMGDVRADRGGIAAGHNVLGGQGGIHTSAPSGKPDSDQHESRN